MTPRRINPTFSFRFTTADIRKTYGSAERAFARGDFLNAAQMASPGSELKGCSLILGGLLEQGLAILEKQKEIGGEARLCQAFALWSLNRPEEAAAAIADIKDPAWLQSAANFSALIGRNNINVFITGAILSIFPEHNTESFTAPTHRYGSITVKYLGSQLRKNAYDYSAVESLETFIEGLAVDEKPDILFALSPQWLVAKDFDKVAVPKVIWCHDSDAFQYRNVDNYALYDVAICNCSQEHFELSQGTPNVFCAANMLLHPLATPFPEASPHREKKYDVIFTGSAMAPFHSEKPRFLFKLAELGANYVVRIIDGHMPEKEYFATISQAKFLPIINRYAGSPSPRWRDALANGSFLLYPAGTFYGEIAPGCFPFRAETMVDDVRAHIDNFANGTDDAYSLAEVVPEINARFAIHRQPREESFERLLKYALFAALIWPRPIAGAKSRRQRRLVWLTPAVDCGLFGIGHVRDLVSVIADNIGQDELNDEIGYNNAAHLYAQMVYTFHESTQAGQWTSRVDQYLKKGLARYPNSLLLAFNEAHWSFFRPKSDISAAAEKFKRIIERFDELTFDVAGADVAMAYTLHERDAVFPCYEYADVATSEMVLAATPELRVQKPVEYNTRRIILSACYGYLGWASLKAMRNAEGLSWLRRSLAVYPCGLPVLRLYFDTLFDEFLHMENRDAAELGDAFVAVVNVNPSILLTHVFVVVPLLAENGERQLAKDIFAAWYPLANIVHSLRTENELRHDLQMDLLWNCQSLFPDVLAGRIETALSEGSAAANLTQLELGFVDAAKRGGLESRRRRLFRRSLSKEAVLRFTILAVLAGTERISLANMWQAFLAWLKAPFEVKLAYAYKACRLILRGEARESLSRIQQWSKTSKWSRGAALNVRRRGRARLAFEAVRRRMRR